MRLSLIEINLIETYIKVRLFQYRSFSVWIQRANDLSTVIHSIPANCGIYGMLCNEKRLALVGSRRVSNWNQNASHEKSFS